MGWGERGERLPVIHRDMGISVFSNSRKEKVFSNQYLQILDLFFFSLIVSCHLWSYGLICDIHEYNCDLSVLQSWYSGDEQDEICRAVNSKALCFQKLPDCTGWIPDISEHDFAFAINIWQWRHRTQTFPDFWLYGRNRKKNPDQSLWNH